MKTKKSSYEVKITTKGQMVIPKPLRKRYNLKEGTKAKIIEVKEGLLIKPIPGKPSAGLRGMMKKEWDGVNLDQIILEAKRSFFKVGLRGRALRR